MEKHYFECQCYSIDHTFRIDYDSETQECYINIQLTRYGNIFQRVWRAIRYIFGFTAKYGHWDVTLIRPEDKQKLIQILEQIPEPEGQ